MSYSYTNSSTQSFTVTHAKHIAAKVAADLKRLQRFYDYPTDASIEKYEEEVITLLKHGYLGSITYGFQRNEKWIEPTLRYTAKDLSIDSDSDDPGRIRPGADTDGASFCSYLTYSDNWKTLSSDEKQKFRKGLPFQRTNAEEPSIDGNLVKDHTYASGGKAVDRYQVKSNKYLV